METRSGGNTFNGLGWIFGLALTVSAVLLFFMRGWDCWLVVLALLLSIIVQPHSWWARFVPQLWYIPILIFSIIRSQTKTSPYFSANFACLILIISAALAFQSGYVFFWRSASMVGQAALNDKFLQIMEENPGGSMTYVIGDNNFSEASLKILSIKTSDLYTRILLRQENLKGVSVGTLNTERPVRQTIVARCGPYLYHVPHNERPFHYPDSQILIDRSHLSITFVMTALPHLYWERFMLLVNTWRK